MATRFLPQDPSKIEQGSNTRRLALKKTVHHPLKPASSGDGPLDTIVHKQDKQSINARNDYERGLEKRFLAAQREHLVWYEGVASEKSLKSALQFEQSRIKQTELQHHLSVKRDAHAEIQQIQLNSLRAEHTKRAENRRLLEAERVEQLRRVADEDERQRQEEERRRQEEAEQIERERRARLRECTVCFDEDDMTSMKQLACEHWYCRDDLRGT